MGGFAGIFKGLLGGDPVRGISSIIEEFHLSPEQKAQLQQAAQELELRREEIEAARDQALSELQVKAITTETGSQDKYVSRARPTFLYAMIAAIVFSVVVVPLIGMAAAAVVIVRGNMPMAAALQAVRPLDLPPGLLELFGVAFVGYVGARSFEKFTALPGDSQIKLPLGIQVGNKGP